VLRVVVLETSAACVQLAQDFSAADVGLAVLDPSKPVQVSGCCFPLLSPLVPFSLHHVPLFGLTSLYVFFLWVPLPFELLAALGLGFFGY